MGIAAGSLALGGAMNQVSAQEDPGQEVSTLLGIYKSSNDPQVQENLKTQIINQILNNGGANLIGHLNIAEMTPAELENVANAFIQSVNANNQASQEQAEDESSPEPEEPVERDEKADLEEAEAEETDDSVENEEDKAEDQELANPDQEKPDETEVAQDQEKTEVTEEELVEPENLEDQGQDPNQQVQAKEEPGLRQVDPNAPALKSSQAQDHVVQPGETLYSIARDYNTSAEKLAAINNINNPNNLRVGQTLTLHQANVDSAGGRRDFEIQTFAATPAPQETIKTGNEFIDNISAEASQVADEYNLYASVMIAQAALETGYGKSSLSQPPHHNLFGMKGSYNGQTANFSTQEDTQNGMVTIRDNFRSYPNYTASLRDYADKLRNGLSWDPNYYSGTWKENTNTYRDATRWLTGRYATDRNYDKKLNRIIEQWDLTRFDNGPVPANNTNTVPVDNDKQKGQRYYSANPSQTSAGTYVVQPGDSLYRIGQNYNVTVGQLKNWNNLTSDLIHPGQVLRVAGPSQGKQASSTPAKPSKPAQANKPSQTSKPTQPSQGGSQTSSQVTYTVKPGDSLYRIGQNHNVTVGQLKNWNNLTSDLIHPGQVLRVAGPSQGKQASSTPAKPSKPAQANKPSQTSKPTQPSQGGSQTSSQVTYTVKPGDSLYRIGQNHNVTVGQLKNWNNLTSDLIHPGQVLRVAGPSQGKQASSTPAKPSKPAQANKPSQTSKPTQPSQGGSQTSSQATYTVKPGDSLYRIALNHNTTVPRLRAINGIKGDLIHPGQVIRLSEGQATASSSKQQSAQPASNQPASQTYTVKPGDTLYKIGQEHNLSVAQLKDLNQLTGDLIHPGQVLRVSQSGRKPAQTVKASKKTNQSTSRPSGLAVTYTVRPGDTLSAIARRYNLSVNQLVAWNKLDNPNHLSVGQTLVLNLRTDAKTSAKPQKASWSTYTVKAGDTLYHIARQHGTSVANLKALNGLTSDLILVGQELRVK